MNEEACNKKEAKALDEFMSRAAKCIASTASRVQLINEICDKLNGPEPQEGCGEEKVNEPQTIFEKFNKYVGDMEIATRALESATDRLNAII